MDWTKIFVGRATKLAWGALPDGHGGPAGLPTAKGTAYVEVRLKEMFLRTSRRLWRKYYPMLHAVTRHGAIEEHSVAGPGQLRELGDANLDRLVNLNQRIAGPIPYNGEDFSIVVGLYAIPGADASKALVDTVGSVAQLAGVAKVAPVLEILRSGIESIVGLSSATLQLGILDTFYAGNPLRPGARVGIAAPRDKVSFDELWLSNGTLKRGDDPVSARSYEQDDYMVLEISTPTVRDDWRRLPRIVELEAKFNTVLGNTGVSVEAKRKQIDALWPSFRDALWQSAELIESQRELIEAAIAKDLRGRIDAQGSGGVFEVRGTGGVRQAADPTTFDLLDVDDSV
jgi:hypothetical protein